MFTLVVACAEEKKPAQVATDYLHARLAGDADKLGRLACNEWEAEAKEQATSFQSLDANFISLSCKEDSTDGDDTIVSCEGEIEIIYSAGENRQQPIAVTYQMRKEDDEWRVCGESTR